MYDINEINNTFTLLDNVNTSLDTNTENNQTRTTKNKTKLFLDTEFTGLHKNTTMISIGIVSECGKTFYAEFLDYDKEQVLNEPWLQDNVISRTKWLRHVNHSSVSDDLHYLKSEMAVETCAISSIIRDRLTKWLSQFDEVEVWADTLAYDWVLFCDIWGHAFNIPSNIDYIPLDLSVLFYLALGNSDYSRAELSKGVIKRNNAHNALYDAQVTKICYYKLLKIIDKRGIGMYLV